MEQTVLTDSLNKHLDALYAIVNYAILLSLAVTWAGLQRNEQFDILGLKFSRKQALFAVSPLYLITNMATLILFLRIGDLLWLLDRANFPIGLTRLATHPWLLNAFALFGTSTAAKLYQSEGYGLLIITWWLCNSSLLVLADDIRKQTRAYFVFTVLFLCIGLGAMGAINRIFEVIYTRLYTLNPALQQAIRSAKFERGLETFLGIGIGGLLHLGVIKLQRILAVRREMPQKKIDASA